MEADDRRFEETVRNLFIGEGNVVSVGPVWLLTMRWRACCQLLPAPSITDEALQKWFAVLAG